MKMEIENLEKQNTWVVVDRPKDHNVIGCKWVLTVKRDGEGNFVKCLDHF
jgi:hypothetical protein